MHHRVATSLSHNLRHLHRSMRGGLHPPYTYIRALLAPTLDTPGPSPQRARLTNCIDRTCPSDTGLMPFAVGVALSFIAIASCSSPERW